MCLKGILKKFGFAKNAGELLKVPIVQVKTQWTGYKKKEMGLVLKRKIFTNHSTIGDLFMGDQFICYTLEDTVRKEKIPNETAIPHGSYEVIINFSNRFQKPLPLLLNVPHFKGIRIHPGNTPWNTRGCILVGRTKSTDFIGESVLAFDDLFPRIDRALKTQKLYIHILNGA